MFKCYLKSLIPIKMEHAIMPLNNYLIVVDDSEIKVDDFVYFWNGQSGSIHKHKEGYATENIYGAGVKIIAHLPLHNSPILEGVPLLPPLEQEDDVEEIDFNSFKNQDEWTWTQYKDIFPLGYNKAKEKYKLFTIEKAIQILEEEKHGQGAFSRDEYKARVISKLQSLSQPKMPIGFERDIKIYLNENGAVISKIKTTPNSQGQTQWVGEYIYTQPK